MNWDAHLQSLSFPPAFFGCGRLPCCCLSSAGSAAPPRSQQWPGGRNTHTNRFPHFHKSWNTPPALPSHLWILVPNRAPAAQLALTDASVPAILQAILHRLIWHHFRVSQQRTGGSFITKPESHASGERCKSRTCFKSVSWGNISSTKGRKWHRGPLFLHGCGPGPQIKVYEHVKFLHVSLRFMVLVINGMVLFHHLIVYKFSVANLAKLRDQNSVEGRLASS